MIPQVKCDGVDCHSMNYLVYCVALALGLALQACGGGGSSISASGNSSLASDLQTSSYGYKAAVSQFAPQVQVSALTGLAVTDLDTRNVVTFGDFFQEGPGAIAAFVMANQPGALGLFSSSELAQRGRTKPLLFWRPRPVVRQRVRRSPPISMAMDVMMSLSLAKRAWVKVSGFSSAMRTPRVFKKLRSRISRMLPSRSRQHKPPLQTSTMMG